MSWFSTPRIALARKAVYQGLVLEEMEKAGVRAEFLNYPVDDSPESKMLLGMQGLFAEYERAKIMERTRRGKLHRAREGALAMKRARLQEDRITQAYVDEAMDLNRYKGEMAGCESVFRNLRESPRNWTASLR